MVIPLATPSMLSAASKSAPKPEKSEAELKCTAAGGKWDGTKCIMPTPEPKQEPITTTKPSGEAITSKNVSPEEYEAYRQSLGFGATDKSQFGTLKDVETGRLSGFEQGGKTFLGVSPEETRRAVESEASKQELQVGGQAETVLTARQQEAQRQGLNLSAQVGQDPLQKLQSQFSAQQVNYVGAIASTVPGLIPDLVKGFATGAGVGALGGTVVLPGVGTVAGATGVGILGAIGNGINGFYSDFVSDVARQKGELIETPIRTLTETKSIINDIISAQNANPADAKSNLEAFNSQLQLLDDEYDRLKDLTDDDLNMFLGDTGINQMQEYQVYFIENGERDQQVREMQIAMANPDPTMINPSTVTIKQINKRIEEEIAKLGNKQ